MTKPLYNIYFGTIGKTLGIKYHFTAPCINNSEATALAKKEATLFYYKNEGKYGIPSFIDLDKESQITGISVEKLCDEHIYDLCRWYAIPTELDTIPKKKIRFK